MPSKPPNIHLDKELIAYINYLRVQNGLKELKLNEQVLLSGARDGKKYEVIAKEHKLPLPTLRQVGSALFRSISNAIPGLTVKKSDFHLAYPQLLELAKEHFASQAPQEVSGSMPSASGGFYGRGEEVEKLQQQLQYSGAIIVLSGMKGIGRRTLTSHFLQKAQSSLIGTNIVWVHSSHRSLIDQSYKLLDTCEQDFTDLLKKGKYLFIFEDGESLQDNSQNIDFLRTIQRLESQAIVISTMPLKKLSFTNDFPLSGLDLDDAMLIAKELGFEGRWWTDVVESFGGNPGFIRQYLNWVKTSLGMHHKELILRSTVQCSVISPFLENLLDSCSKEDLELLMFILKSDTYLSLADILMVYPAQALRVEELFHRGFIEKRIVAQQGRTPKDGRKPVYMVPDVLKKYILSNNADVTV